MTGAVLVLSLMLAASAVVMVWALVDHRRYVATVVVEDELVSEETVPLPVGRWGR